MATPKRFFAENITVGGLCPLTGEEFEHAKNVLRLSVGDEVVLLDNSGKEYEGIVAEVQKKSLSVNVLREREGEKEAKEEVAILFGYLKNADKNEFIVQKAVELGAKKILCFSSQFSSAYMNENKLERLQKVSRESAKQCLRSIAPIVEYCPSLEEALARVENYQNKLFACEFAQKSERPLQSLQGSTAIVVGSEGGFSREEANVARERGFSWTSLGKRILRAETAAISLLSVVMYSLGEWGEVEP